MTIKGFNLGFVEDGEFTITSAINISKSLEIDKIRNCF